MNTSELLEEVEQEIEKWNTVAQALRGLNGNSAHGMHRRKRRLSADARARISAAQKLRWAKAKRKAKA